MDIKGTGCRTYYTLAPKSKIMSHILYIFAIRELRIVRNEKVAINPEMCSITQVKNQGVALKNNRYFQGTALKQ